MTAPNENQTTRRRTPEMSPEQRRTMIIQTAIPLNGVTANTKYAANSTTSTVREGVSTRPCTVNRDLASDMTGRHRPVAQESGRIATRDQTGRCCVGRLRGGHSPTPCARRLSAVSAMVSSMGRARHPRRRSALALVASRSRPS
jgi:hypothetical protein